MLSQKNIFSAVSSALKTVPFTPDDVLVSVLPVHHTYELMCLLAAMTLGMTVCINDSLRHVMKNFKLFKPNALIIVPLYVYTFYKRIWSEAKKTGQEKKLRLGIGMSRAMTTVGIDKRRDLFKDVLGAFGGNLEKIICGGAALNQDIIDFFESIGVIILNGYGITECAPLVAVNSPGKVRFRSVGTPVYGCQVKIDDPDPENGTGEILVKGDNVMLGYYNNNEANEAAKRNVVEKMWLNYYNNMLLAKGLITESQHRKMRVSINSRKPSALKN